MVSVSLYRYSLVVLALVAATTGSSVRAQQVTDAWVRGTVKGMDATGAFMHIEVAAPMSLIGASSPVAGSAQVHQMSMSGNVMNMGPVDQVPIVPGKPDDLAPGGYHVMLMNLKQELTTGDTVPITLRFRQADNSVKSVEVKAQVRALAGGNSGGHMH